MISGVGIFCKIVSLPATTQERKFDFKIRLQDSPWTFLARKSDFYKSKNQRPETQFATK